MRHLDIQVEDAADGLTIRPMGEADHATANSFHEALLAALDHASGAVVIDLGRLDFIDSAGLTVLVAGFKQANKLGLAYSLAAPQPHLARRLAVTALDTLFTIHPTYPLPAS